ncbi:MAG: Uncharacterized protein CEN88_470 [Candidatus Berkelbacteria bacterium Licking1014_2]|uniref:PIN domain-containing protein n=1 Tax=Candidatus Berkelbacteria bacterium Licking1014_2 TaxID=2017146 RepID=A0A554LRP1_9BACT|nr:MAG: Uncharacterized protein CEN88_470 [Candidatus Berkelbacteria bacterium Licking1014_2]
MPTVVLDTNCIIDYFLKRPGYLQVRHYFEQAIDKKINIYLPLAVILELEWTLRRFYKLPKTQIITLLGDLLLLPNCLVREKYRLLRALRLYGDSNNVSFDDCIIALEAKDLKCDGLITSDTNLKKLYRTLGKFG